MRSNRASNRRIFRRRRQQAGAAIFSSLAVLTLAGLVSLGTKVAPLEAEESNPMAAVDSVTVAQAPETIEETAAEAQKEKTSDPAASRAAKDEKAQADTSEDKAKKAEANKKAEADKKAAADKEESQPEANKEAGKSKPEKGKAQSKEEPKSQQAAAPEKKEYDPPAPNSTALWLTVPKMAQVQGDVVRNTAALSAMDRGAIKLPATAFPWQDNANTYIAAHVLGYSGTASYYQFAQLPSMTYGDAIYLTDANGTTYKYVVSMITVVSPSETWVTEPVAGKDLVTLQTCINPPVYDQRLIVRGKRVDIIPPSS